MMRKKSLPAEVDPWKRLHASKRCRRNFKSAMAIRANFEIFRSLVGSILEPPVGLKGYRGGYGPRTPRYGFARDKNHFAG